MALLAFMSSKIKDRKCVSKTVNCLETHGSLLVPELAVSDKMPGYGANLPAFGVLNVSSDHKSNRSGRVINERGTWHYKLLF